MTSARYRAVNKPHEVFFDDDKVDEILDNLCPPGGESAFDRSINQRRLLWHA